MNEIEKLRDVDNSFIIVVKSFYIGVVIENSEDVKMKSENKELGDFV